MKKIFSIAILVATVGTVSFAQSNVTLAYSIGLPTGDLSSFIGKSSFRGISFDYRYKFQHNMAVGLNVAWNVFYEELSRDSYTLGTETITGKQYRYSNNFPMLATFTYFLSEEEEGVVPFASFGIGTMYTRRNTDMNLYTIEQEAWNFLIQPEIGVHYGMPDGFGLSASLKYNHGFAAGSELTEAQSYLSLNLGFNFN